ncbi:hypothetical protein C7999DRAFT_36644 [Corynascus novoguineensis]|uniref:Uncharacterized protein n=1 Tax=Corynascus novoguineensis TaxID=1126955 RepID=A0AAN7CJP6_9PEZI|nr:hypothetical protein C7999DRAFT_36644 [Corynascus novoguineensis]
MTTIEEQYKHLRLNNEIKPLLHRYGIQYNPKANKASLLQLLLANGVPLDRVQQNETAPDLNAVEVLGLTQIDVDYPPTGSDEGSGSGSGGGSGGTSGEGSGENSESGSATTRSIQRLVDLPDHEGHADKAREAGIPDPEILVDGLTELERQLLLGYPVASTCLPTITRGLSRKDLKKKVTGLVDWFAAVAKSQNIPIGPALVFFDSYLSSPELDFVAYLLDKDNYREGWHASSPGARKQAAKRLDNLWSLALDPTEVAGTATTTTTTSSNPTSDKDFFMNVIDPFDNVTTEGKVIGMHMTKKNTLVECKSGKELEAYKQYLKTFPNKGKLSSADESLLAGYGTPADFELDSVFRMKWGRTHHIYGYGRPKKGDLGQPLMFSKTTLSKAFKGAAAVEMLQTHMIRTGQVSYEGTDKAQPEEITLRAKRPVQVQ